MPCPGRFTERITIERIKSDATLDPSGRVDRTAAASWEAFDGGDGERWAIPHNQTGREIVQGQALHSETSHVFDVRWDSKTKTIDAEHRVRLGSTTYQILAAFEVTDDGERRERMRLLCKVKT